MKTTLTVHIYPLIMVSILKKPLHQYYSTSEVKSVFSSTNTEYKNVVRRAPEIGGKKNIYFSSYLMGAYLIALYKNVKDKLSLEQMNDIISNGLNEFILLKKKMQKKDLLSSEYKQKINNAGLWMAENKEKYPTNWLVEVQDKNNIDLTHIVFKRCGLCALCTNEAVPEFAPCLCATDYITMSFANCNLERPTTLSKGDNCCDFFITRKG